MAKPGQPIGGIVVKGGKNPGGNLITAVSDANGGFELNGLEIGFYAPVVHYFHQMKDTTLSRIKSTTRTGMLRGRYGKGR